MSTRPRDATIRMLPLMLLLLGNRPLEAAALQIDVVHPSPQVDFAVSELRAAATARPPHEPCSVTLQLVAGEAAQGLQPEGFRTRRNRSSGHVALRIEALDPAGLLYGGLDVAEILRTTGLGDVRPSTQNPYMQLRGTKFNIPLDVRTPSYTDVCDAAQINIPDMWDLTFWHEYLDTLARYRYNYVSLWNLHPFPSLVKVPEYPDVALNDVWRSRIAWREHYPLQGREFVTDEILSDVEVVRRMTIEDKIDFWRDVMAYGKSRNVDFYVVTWNIFTYGVDGKYGITDDFRNPTTTDYFRCSVRQMFQTYPDLAGIGLTTGENMADASFQDKEMWAMATYGRGILDAAREQPGRRITLIHRQHQAKATEIAATFQPVIEHPDIAFLFSFKYAKAHVYSATTQPYHEDFVDDLGQLKTIWTLRNDDVYSFRWGAPSFVREFVRNIPHDVSRGYYFGSDQYVWGREFLQRHTHQRFLEIDKHWYQWLLWGRFAYDPQLSDQRLQALIADRFDLSFEDAARVFEAWQQASMVYPVTTGFHWGALDFQWYIEGCQSRAEFAQNASGFHDVNRFISLRPHPRAGVQSIPQFVRAAGRPSDLLSPLDVADRLDRHAHRARTAMEGLPSNGNLELARTRADMCIVSELGAYYADKIRGATRLAAFRESQAPETRLQAVRHLADAARHWHTYATLALREYRNPLWTNRVGFVDWKRNYLHTLHDIRIAGGDPADFDLPKSVDEPSESVPRPNRLRDPSPVPERLSRGSPTAH